ncbi:MAG: Mov34/MPN/PAD-1 family protein [Thermoplasmata archaeon]
MKYRIKRQVLEMIMESSKDTMPNEFAAFLRARAGIIYEIVMIPTISGRRSATYMLHMKPIDFSIVGTVHSHPSGVLIPSDEDLHLFSQTGNVHIIVGYPFRIDSFRAFDRYGKPIEVDVI